jgi:hypothetical protein
MKNILMGLGLGACAAWPSAYAQSCSGHSPAHTVALLELYTSEGCSSCPPADRYLSALRTAGVTTSQAVPLSLHVDYWNDIGWTDPYSSAVFTQRQRRLAALVNSRTVYTPEVFVGARELRDWSGGVPEAVKRINAMPARASIGITLGRATTAGMPVEVTSNGPNGALLQVALVHNNVTSKVGAGENRGRTLHHDFVVRQWLAAQPIGANGSAQLARILPLPAGVPVADLAVTAFVESARGEVLQAFSLPACAAPAGEQRNLSSKGGSN